MTSLKEKLGFGVMKNEDEFLTENFVKAAKPKNRFDAAISSLITNMLMQMVIPWIKSCFEKYTQEDFHYQMSHGFDFIADWRANHEERFDTFLKVCRRIRNRFDYDSVAIFHEVMGIFNNKGWVLSEDEMKRMMQVILDLREMIYKD